MKTYAFYEHGKKIAEFVLYDEKEAYEKAIELSTSLSYAIKSPEITYKEIDDVVQEI